MIDLTKPHWRWFFGLPIAKIENKMELKPPYFHFLLKRIICFIRGHNFNYSFGSPRGQWSICGRCGYRKRFRRFNNKQFDWIDEAARDCLIHGTQMTSSKQYTRKASH